MKGYCKCGSEIDEIEFTELGMCLECYTINTHNDSYKQGYTDALFDICDGDEVDDNDGDWVLHIEDDYD